MKKKFATRVNGVTSILAVTPHNVTGFSPRPATKAVPSTVTSNDIKAQLNPAVRAEAAVTATTYQIQ